MTEINSSPYFDILPSINEEFLKELFNKTEPSTPSPIKNEDKNFTPTQTDELTLNRNQLTNTDPIKNDFLSMKQVKNTENKDIMETAESRWKHKMRGYGGGCGGGCGRPKYVPVMRPVMRPVRRPGFGGCMPPCGGSGGGFGGGFIGGFVGGFGGGFGGMWG